jgi:hypothetical protein
MLTLLLAWRCLRLIRRLLLLGAIGALLLILSDGQLARVTHEAFWRSQANTVQRDVQSAVQRALRASPTSSSSAGGGTAARHARLRAAPGLSSAQ